MTRCLGWMRSRPVEASIVTLLMGGFLVWGGVKPSTPGVWVEHGIRLDSVIADARGVVLQWTALDERLAGAEYVIQSREFGALDWQTLGRTSATRFAYTGFTVDRSRLYRIAAVVPEK